MLVRLTGYGDFGQWRDRARALLSARTGPDAVSWTTEHEAGDDLFAASPDNIAVTAGAPDMRITVPAAFIALAENVVCHRRPARFALLYRLLWRLQQERHLLEIRSDADVSEAMAMEKSVRRDSHKMKAFVRFREVEGVAGEGRRRFAAWFEPDHFIVGRTAGFFRRRFADMDWVIMTPHGSSAWDGQTLSVSDAPCEKPQLDDLTEKLWRTYYASIFNPARLKVKAMQSEMPKKYWKNLPEAGLIPQLIAGAGNNVAQMIVREPTLPPVRHVQMQRLAAGRNAQEPAYEGDALGMLAHEAAACRRCPLHADATGTVFGEGPADARIMLVGEQAGDHEDLAGRPFVGPAGRLLDSVLGAAGIDRSACYVTNAVKHFKYRLQGKRRIHQRPDAGEVNHCRWWLDREIAAVRPKIIVAMGATAFLAITRARSGFSDMRGQMVALGADTKLLVTVHPAFLLRIPEPDRREEETHAFRRHIGMLREFVD